MKNPKKMKVEEEEGDDDHLDDLVVEPDPEKRQATYSNLKPGGFVTKGADRKSRLNERHARIAAAAGEPDDNDDDDDDDETEQGKLECKARELSSQLKKQNEQRHWHEIKKKETKQNISVNESLKANT